MGIREWFAYDNAISCKDWKQIRAFVEDGQNPERAFMLAIEYGQTDLVKLMLEKGADPNYEGFKPLHMAAWHGRTEIAEMLIEAGANPLAGNGIALSTADRVGQDETYEAIRKSVSKRLLGDMYRGDDPLPGDKPGPKTKKFGL